MDLFLRINYKRIVSQAGTWWCRLQRKVLKFIVRLEAVFEIACEKRVPLSSSQRFFLRLWLSRACLGKNDRAFSNENVKMAQNKGVFSHLGRMDIRHCRRPGCLSKWRRNASSFFNFSVCLSRACLGESIVLKINVMYSHNVFKAQKETPSVEPDISKMHYDMQKRRKRRRFSRTGGRHVGLCSAADERERHHVHPNIISW
jgi:hypothetical protein